MKLLPMLDDFDLAMQHVPDEIAGTQWFNGLRAVQRKLQTVMEGEGVKPIDALGTAFDPNVHDAVMHEDGRSRERRQGNGRSAARLHAAR